MGRDNIPMMANSTGQFGDISRRNWLKLGATGLGAATLGLGGETATVSASHSDEYLNLEGDVPTEAMDLWQRKPDVRQEYDTVDASDYDGRSGDLSELIEDASAQDAIVDLGSGTYEMESTVTGSGNVVGVVGDGPAAATIYYRGTQLDLLFELSIPTGVLEGVTFDISETTDGGNDTDVGLLVGKFSDEFWAEDVVLRGARHYWQDLNGDGTLDRVGDLYTFRVDMTASDAEGLINRCSFPDGGTPHLQRVADENEHEDGESWDIQDAHTSHAIGPNADPDHVGLNVWKDVYASGFVNNGFYVSNSPGRNVLWNCYAGENGAGNVRISTDDYVVGGTSRIEDLPDDPDLEGRAQSLVHDKGDNVKVVGLSCEGTGEEYGPELARFRSDAKELLLDRVVMNADGDSRFAYMSAPDLNLDVTDCYWHDEGANTWGQTVMQIKHGHLTSDADWRALGDERHEVRIMEDYTGSMTHDGQYYDDPGTYTASELGMEDPRPLPSFYFDYGHHDGKFTVDKGIWRADGTSTQKYRYNMTDLRSLVGTTGYGDAVTFNAHHRDREVASYQGVQVRPDMPLAGFRVQIDPDSSGIDHATIWNTSGDILAEEDVSGHDPGDYVDITYDLEAGTAYYVLLGVQGDGTYDRGSSDASYPVETDGYTVENGIYGSDGASSTSYRYNVTEIQSITDANGSTVAFDANNRSRDVTSYQGVEVEPNTPLGGLRVQIDPDTSGITHATLRNDSGDILAETDVSGHDPGDYVDLTYDLEAGVSYWVLLGANGDMYTRGSSAESYPMDTDDYTVQKGIYGSDGASTTSYRYNVTEIHAISAAGDGATAAGGGVRFNAHTTRRSLTTSSYQGVQVTPDDSLSGFRLQIDPETSGLTHATIRNTSGDVLAETDLSGVDPGEYVDIEYDLEAGTSYLVVLGNHGNNYTRTSSHTGYPVKSSGGDQN